MGCNGTATSAVRRPGAPAETPDRSNQLNRLNSVGYIVDWRRAGAPADACRFLSTAAARGPEDMEIKVCLPADFAPAVCVGGALAKSPKSSPPATNFRESLP